MNNGTENPMGKEHGAWLDFKGSKEGKIGENIINGGFYPHIVRAINDSPTERAIVMDAGAGEQGFARDMLLENVDAHPVLRETRQDVLNARGKIGLILGLEYNADYIAYWKQLKELLGPDADKIVAIHANLEEGIPVQEGVHVAASRMLLMHLSPAGLRNHFRELSERVLVHHAHYHGVVLGKKYEMQKFRDANPDHALPARGQKFGYPHGNPGEQTELVHYNHSEVDYREAILEAGLTIHADMEPILPKTDAHRQTHPRYYKPEQPMAVRFHVEKNGNGQVTFVQRAVPSLSVTAPKKEKDEQ